MSIIELIIPTGGLVEDILAKKFLGGEKGIKEFNNKCARFKECQLENLRSIIEDNEGTRWGRDHKFSNLNPKSWKDMPITTYEDFRPYIERMRRGDINVLTSEAPIALALTSGTTANPKLVPITPEAYEIEKQASNIWNFSLKDKHGRHLNKVLMLKGGLRDEENEKFPVKSYTEIATERQMKIVQKRFVFPKSCDDIKDLEHRLLIAAQQAFISEPKTLISVNSLTIDRLLNLANENRLEIERATVRGKYVGTEKDIGKINNERETISRIREENPLQSVKVIGTWTGGTQNLFLDKLKDRGIDAKIRDLGYIASEGRFSIPLEDNTSSGVLNPFGIYYEFMTLDKSKIVPVDDLSIGEEYNIVITGRNGLYRYDMQDVIRVDGFYGETPTISFMRKDASFSNIVGEKIHENQVIELLRAAEIYREKVFLKPNNEGQRYELILERGEREEIDSGNLDKLMRKINPEYDSKRESERLKGMEVIYVSREEIDEIDKNLNKRQDHDRFKRKYLIPQ